MKVLVCGGRNYQDREGVYAELDRLRPSSVLCGGASGADQLARDWAHSRKVVSWVSHADWKTHGRAAGPIRNQAMLDEHKPGMVLAFPGGRGTADMIRRAEAAGVQVEKVER